MKKLKLKCFTKVKPDINGFYPDVIADRLIKIGVAVQIGKTKNEINYKPNNKRK